MRKPYNRHLRNAVQNTLIAALVLSALVLLLRTNLIRSDALGDMFSSVTTSVAPPESSAVPVQIPVHIETRTGNQCQAWLNETTAGEVFGDFGALLLEGLGSVHDAAISSAEEFCRALENDNIYYDFTTTLPLPLLAHWLDDSSNAPQMQAQALMLSAAQDGTVTLFAWNSTADAYTRWRTSISAESLRSTAERHSGTQAEFAFLSGAPYDTLAPYTLICQERVTLPVLSAATIVEAEEDALLTHLEFNVHTNSRYPESNGTEVIVQGMRTLRLSPDGIVRYDGGDESVSLLCVEHAGEYATEQECADAAWKLANALVAPYLGDASLYLLSSTIDQKGSGELLFGFMVQGVPIVSGDSYAMRVEMAENSITAFTVHLRSYTLTEQTLTLLPVLQAAAAAQGETPGTLFFGYYDDGSTALNPVWLRR